MKKTYNQIKSTLRERFLGISVVLCTAIFSCYGQKVYRLSDRKFIKATSAVRKIIEVNNNFFTVINNNFIKFKITNDSTIVGNLIQTGVKDFIQYPQKSNSLFLLTEDSILLLSGDDMSVRPHFSFANIVVPEMQKSITQFEIDNNSLWLLGRDGLIQKIQLTDRRLQTIGAAINQVFEIKFFNNLKLILTQQEIFRDDFNNIFFSDGNTLSKPVVRFSKRDFYTITTSKGDVYATGPEGNIPHILHFKANSENVRDAVFHGTDNNRDLFWIVGNDLKVFSWDERKLLLQLNNTSKPAFASVQSETICPIAGTNKVLVGTWGSGIFLIEYVEKDTPTSKEPTSDKETDKKQASKPPTESKSVKTPGVSVPFTPNIGTSQVPTPKPAIKLIEEKFVLDKFEKDSTTLSPLDMVLFFNSINKKIDFEQIEIKKVKIEGHASKTGDGLDTTKTKEISLERIKFVRQKLTKKYKLTDVIFEEHNYGDTRPIDKKDPDSPKNRAVVVIFEIEHN